MGTKTDPRRRVAHERIRKEEDSIRHTRSHENERVVSYGMAGFFLISEKQLNISYLKLNNQ